MISMRFFKKEVKDIAIAILSLTFIFTYCLSSLNLPNFLSFLGIVIISFFFHELAHRYFAEKYGCVAFFKLFPGGILIGLVLAILLKFVFVAPGAVVIYPYRYGRWGFESVRLTRKERGVISLSGVLVNLFFALIFFPFRGFLKFISSINAWLAFFNLWPLGQLDGFKVMVWNPRIWLALFIVSLLLVLL